MSRKRVDIKSILFNEKLRKDMMVSTIKTIQNREGIPTTIEQAETAYDKIRKSKD